jgi:hypothetical protein
MKNNGRETYPRFDKPPAGASPIQIRAGARMVKRYDNGGKTISA